MSAAVLPDVPALERPPVDWERHRGDGRPKILPPPGEVWRNASGRKIGHRYYTRVTTYADALTEQYNLAAWKLRRLALGLGQRADYVRLAASYTAEDRDRDALDELVGKALEAAGPNAADLGTALHSLTERLDRGDDLGTPPEEVLPDLAAYTAITEGVIAHRHREARTVCDALECAGTPDTIAHVAEQCPAGCGPEVLHIGDTKTGSIRYPGKMSTQLAIYSRSALYDPATGARTPLEVCQRAGFIVHLPVETGEAALFWLDLDHGWAGAELCGPVRSWRSVKTDDILRPFATVRPVRVVDGEVIRLEPRLASTDLKAPEPIVDVTQQLAEALVAAGLPVDLDDAETMRDEQLDGESDDPEAALDGPEVAEVVTHPSGHVEVVGSPIVVGTTWLEGMSAEPYPGAQRCPFVPIDGNLESDRCELVAGHAGPHELQRTPTPIERCVHELRLGECAMPSCRPDLAHLDDDGVERDDGPTELPGAAGLSAAMNATDEQRAALVETTEQLVDEGVESESGFVEWPGIDHVIDRAISRAARSGSDRLALEIAACITVREVEALSSRRWREWSQGHRDLAVDRHDQLAAVEAAAKPRAAFEVAVRMATSTGQLERIMSEVHGCAWLADEQLDLAAARWRELRSAS